MLAVAPLDIPHRSRNNDCDVEHCASIPNAGNVVLRFATLLEHTDDGLSCGQVSRTQQDDRSITQAFEDGHLAEPSEVVDSGVRAGVRFEDDAVLKQNAYAIGHTLLSLVLGREYFIHAAAPQRAPWSVSGSHRIGKRLSYCST